MNNELFYHDMQNCNVTYQTIHGFVYTFYIEIWKQIASQTCISLTRWLQDRASIETHGKASAIVTSW